MIRKSFINKYFCIEKYKEDKIPVLELLTNILCLCIIFKSIYISLSINLLDRSLWIDEAMLAFSFSTRSIGDLTSNIFEWDQSAPVIYLYIVKIITLLFGNTEVTLRIWSFISFVLTLVCSYYILDRILKVKFSLLAIAFISIIDPLLQFSAEFKPYMSDCFAVLFTIIIYHWYAKNKLKKYQTMIIFALMIWFSNPSCFLIGSILAFEFVDGIIRKEYKRVKFSLICGGVILISFAAYFFYWLKPVIDDGYMTEYWEGHKFPLIPLNRGDLAKQSFLIKQFLRYFGDYQNLISAFVFFGLFINLFTKKNKYITIIYGGIIIALFASMLGKYPLADRLCLFIYPLIGILFFYLINRLHSHRLVPNILVLILSFSMLSTANAADYYHDLGNSYVASHQTNIAVEYLEENIKEEDKAYIYRYSIPGFGYKNNYNLTSIGNYKDNVILGSDWFNDGKNLEEINLVINNAPIYILTSHDHLKHLKLRLTPLLDSLRVHGNLELASDRYETNLYYYTNRKENKKDLIER